jgi:DNA-binding MarR family transcriptional regulator
MTDLSDLCAREFMETVPQIMQAIRAEMRLGHGTNISIPQFRALRFIQRHPDSALTNLADYLGLTPPSVSKLVNGLVKQELVTRWESNTDRRRLTLGLTPAGESIVNKSRSTAQASLAQTLNSLSESELETVARAMQLLHPLFAKPLIEKE